MRPWNHATTRPSASSSAARSAKAASSSICVKRTPVSSSSALISASENSGPSSAESAARVARRRLDPDPVEGALAQQPPVGHAVERHAPGQAQIRLPRDFVDVASRAQHYLLGDALDRGGDVHVMPRDLRLGFARRLVEQAVKAGRRHHQARRVVEVVHVHAERAVVP
jgi:hypothetical protein